MIKIDTSFLYEIVMIAIESGDIVMSFYDNMDFRLKDDKSPITQADIESNNHIASRLKAISDYKICSEEAIMDYNQRCNLKHYWLVDPLDGTKDFLAKNGNFTINIALIHYNSPILGVVYAPCLHEMYFGYKNYGAFSYNIDSLKNTLARKQINKKWLDSNKIALKENNIAKIYGNNLEYLCLIDENIRNHMLNNINNLQNNYITIACDSIFHSSKTTQDFIKKYDLAVLKRGSSLKVCSVASGLASIYPRFNGTSEWDTAASDIILRESGGIILDLATKQQMIYNKENIKNNYFIAFGKNQIDKIIYKECFD